MRCLARIRYQLLHRTPTAREFTAPDGACPDHASSSPRSFTDFGMFRSVWVWRRREAEPQTGGYSFFAVGVDDECVTIGIDCAATQPAKTGSPLA